MIVKLQMVSVEIIKIVKGNFMSLQLFDCFIQFITLLPD